MIKAEVRNNQRANIHMYIHMFRPTHRQISLINGLGLWLAGPGVDIAVCRPSHQQVRCNHKSLHSSFKFEYGVKV
jgi:hypothetical protein